MNSRRNLLSGAIFACLFVLLYSHIGLAVAVQPLILNIDVNPGDTEIFSFFISGQDKHEIVNFRFYSVTQNLDGNLQYHSNIPNPVLDWVSLDNEQVLVTPGESKEITGQIDVPANAEGTYVFALMVEPETTLDAEQITIKFRYAIRVIVNVNRLGLWPNITMRELSLNSDEAGIPIIHALVTNQSPLLFPLSAEMTIRDSNRSLVERIELAPKTDEGARTKGIKIYPKADLLLKSELTQSLYPGTYELRLFLRYGDGRQKVFSEQVKIDDLSFVQDNKVSYFAFNPTVIKAGIRPGGASSHVIELKNNSTQLLNVVLEAMDISPEYERSIFANCDVELRGDAILEIPPGRATRVILVLKAPRTDVEGGYYGYLTARAYFEPEEILQSEDLFLQAIIGAELDYIAEVIDASVLKIENELIISLVIENQGNVHITPTGYLYLKDETGKNMATISLTLQEGVEVILPGQASYLIAEDWQVPGGNYTAEIRLFNENELLLVTERMLTIP